MDPVSGISGISGSAGLWGPGAGRAPAAPGAGALRDVEPQRGITLGPAPAPAGPSFSEALSQAIGEVNGLQQRADALVEQLAAGRIENVHDVIIAQQEAALAFRLIQEVRDKLVTAYQELMRMQV